MPLLVAALLAACGTNTPSQPDPSISPVADSAVPAPPKDGPQVMHLQDGGRMEGELRNGQRVGPWVSFFANGGLRSRITYVNGVEEGFSEVFHDNGMIYYSGNYLRGKTIGEWRFYDREGKELKRVAYDSTGVLLK